MKKKSEGKVLDILIRYIILIIVALPNLWLFYTIFTPLTLYPSYWLVKLIFGASLIGTTIYSKLFTIELISACIAGAAYYFLLILNLSIPSIKIKKRVKMLAFAFITFLIANVLRIMLFSILLVNQFPYFDLTHQLFWYTISILFVVVIWFTEVKIFKIKQIPFYTDIKFLYRKSLLKK